MSPPAAPAIERVPAPPERSRSPWWWVPTLYLAQGLPYVLVTSVSGTMYKTLGGISNAQITFYTSLLAWPWTLKPLWSPVVDLVSTRRRWTWTMQIVFAACLAGITLAIPLSRAFTLTLVCFAVLALASASHDIACDGLYLLANSERQQSYFVGIRTTFFRFALVLAQGPLVILAGVLQARSGSPRLAWSAAMGAMALLVAALALWHQRVLPRPISDRPGEVRRVPQFVREFFATFGSFFRKPGMAAIIPFLLLYRFGEAQLVKVAPLFLLDPRTKGGLGLTTIEQGFIYGTMGVIALIIGGILGGVLVARHGLKRWLWVMLFAIHLPDAAFIYLAYLQPNRLPLIQTAIAIEQFGYGFGFTAYVMYMLRVARGPHPTAHYAICTGFMALGMMIPGMWSGWLADHIGYRHFFTWVVIATVPSFVVSLWLPLEPEFGRKAQA